MLRLPKNMKRADLDRLASKAQAAAKMVQALAAGVEGFVGLQQQTAQATAALGRLMTFVLAAQKKFDAEPDAKTAADLTAPDVITMG